MLIPLDIQIEETWFPARWYRPWKKRCWEIDVIGYGVTQALSKEDIHYMARDLAACVTDRHPDDFTVRGQTWLR